jgi:hypothetical protein
MRRIRKNTNCTWCGKKIAEGYLDEGSPPGMQNIFCFECARPQTERWGFK